MLAFITKPETALRIASFAIIFYYFVTIATYIANKNINYKGIFSKGTWLDWTTTVIGIFPIILLIPSFLTIAAIKELTLPTMVMFYIYSIFFFAIIYSTIGWHTTESFENNGSNISMHTEIRYIVVSMQAQTSIGFTRMKPTMLRTEAITSIQSLIGILFVAICIAKAISGPLVQPTTAVVASSHSQSSRVTIQPNP